MGGRRLSLPKRERCRAAPANHQRDDIKSPAACEFSLWYRREYAPRAVAAHGQSSESDHRCGLARGGITRGWGETRNRRKPCAPNGLEVNPRGQGPCGYGRAAHGVHAYESRDAGRAPPCSFDFTSRLGRRAEAGPRRVLPRVSPPEGNYDAFFLEDSGLGIADIAERRNVFTASAERKTLATSGSRTTAVASSDIRLANRFGRDFL